MLQDSHLPRLIHPILTQHTSALSWCQLGGQIEVVSRHLTYPLLQTLHTPCGSINEGAGASKRTLANTSAWWEGRIHLQLYLELVAAMQARGRHMAFQMIHPRECGKVNKKTPLIICFVFSVRRGRPLLQTPLHMPFTYLFSTPVLQYNGCLSQSPRSSLLRYPRRLSTASIPP